MRAFGVDFADFADEGVAQRAMRLANDPTIPNIDPEAMRQQLRKDIFLAVTLHEVGHNMGLRHNFRASFDAMNYFPRVLVRCARRRRRMRARRSTPASTVDDSCRSACPTTGTDCTHGGAAQADDASALRRLPGRRHRRSPRSPATVREFQYSSIMDYGAEFNSDLQGLGCYDKAAMKFSYAGDGFVEVFTDGQARQQQPALVGVAVRVPELVRRCRRR